MSGSPKGRNTGQFPQPTAARDVMLTLLAVAAGCLDAVGYLGLGGVLVAAMTGNTVLLGIALGQADAPAALRATISLAGFVLGAFIGAAIIYRDARQRIWSPRVTWVLALELVILVTFTLAWQELGDRPDWIVDYRYPLIVGAGMAMGLQSAAARQIGVPGVATTYITGTLTSLAARLVGWLCTPGAGAGNQASNVGAPWLPASVWIAYGAGAMFAGVARLLWSPAVLAPLDRQVRWSSAALLLPISIIAAVILIAVIVYRRRPAPT